MSGYTLSNLQDATLAISQQNLSLQPDDLILFIKSPKGLRAVYEDLSIIKETDNTVTLQWMSREQTITASVINPRNPLASVSIPYESFILVTGKALESLHQKTRQRTPVAA